MTFGLFLTTDDILMERIFGLRAPDQRPFLFKAKLLAGSKRRYLNTISDDSVGWRDFFSHSGSTLAEVVAPHLVEGRLTLRADIKSGLQASCRR